jgi:CubicO group peptidase (beta-lactamase class C family)
VTALPGAEAVLRGALDARVYSAVVAEAGDAAGATWTYAAGELGFDNPAPVTPATVFDLASLTKVLSTTALSLVLSRRGDLDIDACVSAVIPEWSRGDRCKVSMRDLLEHSSGLPAHREYFHDLIGVDAYVRAIAAEPLVYLPRSSSVYSDLGFITLGAVIERIGQRSLQEQFNWWKREANVEGPLTYVPPNDWKSRTAVTGLDRWRGRVLQGEVHDQNAAALAGVAAHAGLFGTAAAVGAAARWWLHEFDTADGQRFARRSSVAGSSRALGWDTMLPTSSCGRRMSARAVGHTGFTGTSLWLDLASGRYFVLLTNRVLASQTNDMMQQVRREFHDAVLIDAP